MSEWAGATGYVVFLGGVAAFSASWAAGHYRQFRAMWRYRTAANLLWTVAAVLVHLPAPIVGWSVVTTVACAVMWVRSHDEDDDDDDDGKWRRRVKAVAAKLPRPRLIALRPVGVPA